MPINVGNRILLDGDFSDANNLFSYFPPQIDSIEPSAIDVREMYKLVA